jgi:hypothetical protein
MNCKIVITLMISAALIAGSAIISTVTAARPSASASVEPLPSGLARIYPDVSAGKTAGVPRLESALAEYAHLLKDRGASVAASFATDNDITLEGNRVWVEVNLKQGLTTADISPALLANFNATIKSRSKHFLHLLIPGDDLISFAEAAKQATLIHRPYKLLPDETSEGVALVGANAFHDAGETGAGVNIVVMDMGFSGHADAQGNSDLPAELNFMNYTDEEMDEGEIHGTACAEIVYDMAPGADFTLVKIFTDAHMENAVDELIDMGGVDVISMSLGWLAALGDYFTLVPMDDARWCKCDTCQSVLAKDRGRIRGSHFSSGTASNSGSAT